MRKTIDDPTTSTHAQSIAEQIPSFKRTFENPIVTYGTSLHPIVSLISLIVMPRVVGSTTKLMNFFVVVSPLYSEFSSVMAVTIKTFECFDFTTNDWLPFSTHSEVRAVASRNSAVIRPEAFDCGSCRQTLPINVPTNAANDGSNIQFMRDDRQTVAQAVKVFILLLLSPMGRNRFSCQTMAGDDFGEFHIDAFAFAR